MSAKLSLEPGFSNPDDVYEDLIDMHRDLSDEESARANAKLILLLANHIGNSTIVAEATRVARENTLGWRSS